MENCMKFSTHSSSLGGVRGQNFPGNRVSQNFLRFLHWILMYFSRMVWDYDEWSYINFKDHETVQRQIRGENNSQKVILSGCKETEPRLSDLVEGAILTQLL